MHGNFDIKASYYYDLFPLRHRMMLQDQISIVIDFDDSDMKHTFFLLSCRYSQARNLCQPRQRLCEEYINTVEGTCLDNQSENPYETCRLNDVNTRLTI